MLEAKLEGQEIVKPEPAPETPVDRPDGGAQASVAETKEQAGRKKASGREAPPRSGKKVGASRA